MKIKRKRLEELYALYDERGKYLTEHIENTFKDEPKAIKAFEKSKEIDRKNRSKNGRNHKRRRRLHFSFRNKACERDISKINFKVHKVFGSLRRGGDRMRIWREGSKLFIEVPPKGDKDRTPFFSELSDVLFAGWQNANTVVYDTETFRVRATAGHIRQIAWAVKKRGYEISKEAYSLMQEIARKYEDEREVERMIEEQKRARETAISKLKNGCGWCGLLSFDGEKYVCGANGKPCVTDNEETERLFEEWKQTKVYTRPTPFPNKDCQYLEVLKG